ncbi:MAG: four helix bundle protein [Syntrophobacteria bacterium]
MGKAIKKFAEELEKRTKQFAIDIIRLSMTLPNTPEGRTIRNQLTKAGTSVGANYREANRSRSKKDFRNKIAICESEASETQYWLQVIAGVGWKSWDKLQPDYDECSELLAIFTSIGKN